MNIALIGYMGLEGPGVMHLYHFAHELVRLGHRVFVLLNGDPGSVRLMAESPVFPVVRLEWQEGMLVPAVAGAVTGFRPHVVHAWTPRNATAHAALEIAQRTNAEIFIHYEDDEDYLYRYAAQDLLANRSLALESILRPELWAWQHFLVSTAANHFARAFTAICRPYIERLQRDWGKPVHLLYPGVDLERFHPSAPALARARFGLEGKAVVLYSGSLGSVHGFDLMLEAFALLAPRCPEAVLVHVGRNAIADELDIEIRRLGLRGRVQFLGPVDHHEIHRYLAMGDVLVQSGAPGDFNEYRLPSKLPEYLAMGRPVVTFAAGIGREFEDGIDVIKTHTGDPAEMAARLEQVLADAALRARLGQGARRRAEALFSWPRNAAALATFYQDALEGRLPGTDPGAMARRWPGYSLSSPSRLHRRLLFVASDALPLREFEAGPSGQRAATLAAAAKAAGHVAFMAMPVDACPESADLRPFPDVRLWQARTLPFVIQRLEVDGVVLCGWPALDAFAHLTLDLAPAAADLTGVAPFDVGSPPAELVAALARTRGLLLATGDECASWLPWCLLALGGRVAQADGASASAAVETLLTWLGAGAIQQTEPGQA